jgi:CheY-like chemotaxis protein
MSRILLADDSPHAQRMGERILREEGFEVVTVTDGETALIRLADVDPDLVMADIFLPHKSGYELCELVKSEAKHRHTRVVLLAGQLEPVNETEAARVKADGILKKPFEASVVVATVRPLIEAAQLSRAAAGGPVAPPEPPAPAPPPAALETAPTEPAPAAASADPAPAQAPAAPEPAPAPLQIAAPAPNDAIDAERVRAAVTIALDQAMPALIDELTKRVLVALKQ